MKKQSLLLSLLFFVMTVFAQENAWVTFQARMKSLLEKQMQVKTEMNRWYADYQKRVAKEGKTASLREDTLKAQSFQAEWDAQEAVIKYHAKKYLSAYSNDTLAIPYLMRVFNNYNLPDSDLVLAQKLIATAGPLRKAHRGFKSFSTYIQGKEHFRPGIKFTDALLADTLGISHRLSEYVGCGNYVYIDFWASWCAPCRAELPHVKEAYEALKGQHFNVVSVSLDDAASAWKRAIKAHALPWPQLSSLQGFKSEVARLYGITAIPATLLVSPDGTILATNLRGASLMSEIRKYMKRSGE